MEERDFKLLGEISTVNEPRLKRALGYILKKFQRPEVGTTMASVSSAGGRDESWYTTSATIFPVLQERLL